MMSTNAHSALAGKAALITGAARRVGATIVRKLHAAGANIVLHYRSSADPAEALARELNQARPDSVVSVEADLLDPGQLEMLPGIATSNFGTLDILVNNASTFYPTPMGDITEIDWNDLIGTVVSLAGSGNGAADQQRADCEYRGHSWHAPAGPASGVQHCEGRGDHVDAVTRAGAGTRCACECGRSRPCHVAGGRDGQGVAGADHRSYRAETARLA